jgi:PAS domain S-box-containing protein
MEVRPNPAKKPARLKEALERSQRDLEDFFENGVVGLHWVASDGSILRVNQAELDLLGYTREEYVGRHIAEFHADESVIDDILARLTRGEKLDKYGARLKAKDGSIKHVLISSNVHFRDGQFINTRCFTLDVTDLKRAETALRESDQRLRATHERAFAGSPKSISRAGSSGRMPGSAKSRGIRPMSCWTAALARLTILMMSART